MKGQGGFEQIIRFAMPLTFGFLVLLVVTEIYGLGQIPGEMMATPFSIRPMMRSTSTKRWKVCG